MRYSHNFCQHAVQSKIHKVIAQSTPEKVTVDVRWQRPCQPYLTERNTDDFSLINAAEQAIYHTCHLFPKLSTSGGTSDGRFIANVDNTECCQVIELGVPNKSIHQVNERVAIDDLVMLERIYRQLLLNLMQKATCTS